ncbi:c-type cytochrome [Noviherbaspirillum sp. ST9]|uniref:c-type cytochrome n=1 Tax=Noviherbaspirillum sp. ST9 TaxID=3401606 RepID=UPI003B58A7DB
MNPALLGSGRLLPPVYYLGKGLLFLACALLHLNTFAASDAAPYSPDPARRAELIRLVRQDCGSCHGLTLKGGLGPALLPETLRDKPAESLIATIMGGRPGTPMPPWNRFVNEQEAAWIVDNLQKGFPGER